MKSVVESFVAIRIVDSTTIEPMTFDRTVIVSLGKVADTSSVATIVEDMSLEWDLDNQTQSLRFTNFIKLESDCSSVNFQNLPLERTLSLLGRKIYYSYCKAMDLYFSKEILQLEELMVTNLPPVMILLLHLHCPHEFHASRFVRIFEKVFYLSITPYQLAVSFRL